MLDVHYWGLTFAEWVTVAGLVLGPVVAVGITLVIEGKRRKQEQRLQVMRMLLTTRHLPSDPAYTIAINLIPVEFNDHKPVMEAWNSYLEAVRFRPSEENAAEHDKETNAKQTKLIFAMMRSLGFKLAETDIQISAYAAEGLMRRENILIASQLAMADIAQSMRRQTELLLGGQAANVPGEAKEEGTAG